MCALDRLKDRWWSSVLTQPQPPQSCSSGESCADFLQIRAGCSTAWGCTAPLERLAHRLPVNTAVVLWFFRCPLNSNGNNLQCLTSTPCYLSPAVAEVDVSCQLCHADASSCPDLPCWQLGFNQEPALYSSPLVRSCLVNSRFEPSDTLSPTASIRGEISSCRGCAGGRSEGRPFSDYFS